MQLFEEEIEPSLCNYVAKYHVAQYEISCGTICGFFRPLLRWLRLPRSAGSASRRGGGGGGGGGEG